MDMTLEDRLYVATPDCVREVHRYMVLMDCGCIGLTRDVAERIVAIVQQVTLELEERA